MKIITRILLALAVVFMAYACINSIVTPIKFENERTKREAEVIKNLISLRTAEAQYRLDKGYFTDNLDSLIIYLKTAKMKEVYKVGTLSEKQLEDGMTEEKAVKLIAGELKKAEKKVTFEDKVYSREDSLEVLYQYLWSEWEKMNPEKEKREAKKVAMQEMKSLIGFRRDTIYTNMIQSLYKGQYTENTIDEIIYIPYTDKQKFEVETNNDYTNTQGVRIPIFEIRAHYNTYLHDLNDQERVNLVDKQEKLELYPGLKVGSVEAPNNNSGNWE